MPHRPSSIVRLLARLALVLALGAVARAQELPPGFVAEPIGSGWNSPVGLCFIDEERLLVGERDGRVWYVESGVKRNLVLDIATETLVNGDRGMLGIAVRPDFDLDPWLYLLLVVDVGGQDRSGLGFARLIRLRLEYAPGGDLVALPATRETLLGDEWSTGIPSCHLSHTIGNLRFLSDGSLVLTAGDNAHYDSTDAGGQDPNCFSQGRTPIDQDVGAYRSQYDHTLAGKVLRIDAVTGLGLADNPFFTGDPADLLSRVYARGLRNPFRFTLMPGTGPREALFVGDVGWNLWEEVNLCLGGENFGWPCFEGPNPQVEYQNADVHGFCASAGPEHVRPLLAWHHAAGLSPLRGTCASGISVYRGERYPELYRGRLFFSDYGHNWLRAALLDEDLRIASSIGFGLSLGGMVELVEQPGTLDLVYTTLAGGIFRLRYVGSGSPPVAVASATPPYGAAELDVVLDAAGSFDPDGQDLAYAWDLGDGTSASGAQVAHHYSGPAAYVARVTVTDPEGLTATAEVRITPGNTPPAITDVHAPLDGATFRSDEPLRLAASATDAEDGVPAEVEWTLDLVHDHHVHPDWAVRDTLQALVTPDAHGPGDNHFVVHLRVTDVLGQEDERTLAIYDRDSAPQAHLVEVSSTHVRPGQRITAVAHVDFALGQASRKQARMVFDWGDGSADVVAEARHHVDVERVHAYAAPGTYKLRLVAELDARQSVAVADIVVGPPRPAVAIFAPLDLQRWIPRAEQEAVVAELTAALATRTSEVRTFQLGEGADLAAWMDSLDGDSLQDVLVLLDFVPAPLLAGGVAGSRLRRWVETGNVIVWSGFTPLQDLLDDDGLSTVTLDTAESFFGATAAGIVFGAGNQVPTALGTRWLPSLPAYRASRALRRDALGPEWQVLRLFGEDGDKDADAIELGLAGGGVYAQFLCSNDPELPRAAVLREYLLSRVARVKLAAPAAAPGR
jgi:glucose/arabinose dehydrogenase